jgi:hypothetical protein
MCTHPWYLDPCLGIPIPGRASSARRILHPLTVGSIRFLSAQSVLEKSECVLIGCFTPRGLKRTSFDGPWVSGEASGPLGAAKRPANRGVIAGAARLRLFSRSERSELFSVAVEVGLELDEGVPAEFLE